MDTCNEKIKFKKINLFITGYGPFMNVKENPSQMLVESITNEKEKLECFCKNKLDLKHFQIFEVDCDYVKDNVAKLHEIVSGCDKDCMNLIIHFGVYPGGNGVLLECQSKNYIMDYVKFNDKICHKGDDYCYCKLDIDSLCQGLKSKGHDVNKSCDAGTYLCNYIYFLSSSEFKEAGNVFPLFVHIPPLKEMGTDKCKEIVFDLLCDLQAKYLEE
jgi:pyroglutamyl-peptidase